MLLKYKNKDIGKLQAAFKRIIDSTSSKCVCERSIIVTRWRNDLKLIDNNSIDDDYQMGYGEKQLLKAAFFYSQGNYTDAYIAVERVLARVVSRQTTDSIHL